MADASVAVEYRPVQGFPGYRVGDDGSVWSCFNHIGHGRRPLGNEWNRLKGTPHGKMGYLRIILYRDGKGHNKHVHPLVCAAFHGPCPDGMECCHENNIAGDCRSSNLRWDTKKNNQADRIKHGTDCRGEGHANSKLTEEQVRYIRSNYVFGQNATQLANKFSITVEQVRNIAKRKSWNHVT